MENSIILSWHHVQCFVLSFCTFLLIQKNQIALLAFGKSRKETVSMEDVEIPHAITLDQGLN